MKKPTIYEIRREVEAGADSHFFDRDTLRHFGQTLRNFTVHKSPAGRVFILAATYYQNEGGRSILGGYTFREYADKSLRRVGNVPHGPTDLDAILAYIEAN